jgi:superfamily II DNA or RNA helicase
MHGKPKIMYQKEYDELFCGNRPWIQNIANITSTYGTEQILILVNKKDKCGALVHEYLKSLNISNSYISGDNSKDEINNTIEAFNDKKIRVLIGSSVLGEGIDIRSTDHLVMCQGGKSEIAIVQAIGRAIRLYDGKKKAYIHDFKFEGTKYLIKHSEEREQIYLRNFHCPVYHG